MPSTCLQFNWILDSCVYLSQTHEQYSSFMYIQWCLSMKFTARSMNKIVYTIKYLVFKISSWYLYYFMTRSMFVFIFYRDYNHPTSEKTKLFFHEFFNSPELKDCHWQSCFLLVLIAGTFCYAIPFNNMVKRMCSVIQRHWVNSCSSPYFNIRHFS